MTNKAIKEAVRQSIEVPEDVRRLAHLLTMDLLWGPIEADDDWETANYPDFGTVCERVRQFTETLPSRLWVDVDCDCVMTEEPEGEMVDGEYLEPCWESIYLINGHNEVIEALFNEYLVGYI
jgi:hypothetical protein